MKEKLEMIALAKKKGFVSNIIGKSAESKHRSKDFFYLWLCELLKWGMDNHKLYVNIRPMTFKGHVVYYEAEAATPDMVWDEPIKVEKEKDYVDILKSILTEFLKLLPDLKD